MENPNFIFSSGPVELKEEGEDFFVEGYISTSDLDLVNDVVTKECIMDMADQMKSRTIKLDVEHESFMGNNEIEREINKTIIPVAKIDDFLVDKKGLKIRAMLNRHVKRFNEVKNSIKDGFLDAFSIAFIPAKGRMGKREGQEVRLLDKIDLLNVAFTGNPVNTCTTMTNVFAKSLEYLKDREVKAKDKRPPKAWFDRCVRSVSKKPGVRDPEALCGWLYHHKIGGKDMAFDLDHDHESDNIVKLKEVKKMSDEDTKEETQEAEEKPSESESEDKAEKKPKKTPEEEEEEKKKKVSKKDEDESEKPKEEPAEESAEKKEDSKESEETETKSDIEDIKKDMMEVKAALKKPLLKSKAEQQDKSKNFADEKVLNPLDVIA